MISYSSLSRSYDRLHGREQWEKSLIAAELLEDYKPRRILDVGAGTLIFSEAAGKILSADIFSLEISLSMLLHAGRRNGREIVGRAENLPFKDRSFDAVVSISAFHNFSDKERAMAEINRVTRGIAVLSILKKSSEYDRIIKLLNDSFSIIKDINTGIDEVFLCMKRS